MRIEHINNVFISDDTDGESPLFGRQDPANNKEIIDSFLRCVSGKINIAASGTESVPLGDVDTVRGVQVVLDGDFDVIFNGGAETINFKLADTQTGRVARMFMEAEITAASITNPSGSAALTGTYVIWGDPVP